MKTTFRLLLLFVVMVAAGGKVWGEIRTITITVDSIKNGGGTLGSNSYNNEEETWIQDGVFFGGKAIAAGNGGNTGAIQMQASNGVLYNTTPLPGKIISIELHSINTPRSSSCYGGTSRLVTGTAADYSVTGGAQVGSASETGWTADDFSGTEYLFFAIKRGGNTAGNTAYLSSIVITCDVPPPSVSLSPSALAFGTILVGTTKTLKLNIKGARLTQDIAVSTATDTASVFSIPVATATAAEAMSSSGKSVDVVFTPEHTYSYGGVLKISSADFADTTLVMTGAGAMPTLNVDSSQVRFGKLAVGNSVSKTIRISSVLLTDSISVSFADNASEFFSVAASKLAPNRAATVAITYAPAAAGEHTATLHLQSGLLTKDIPLSGSAASLLLEENFAYGTGQKLTDNGWAAHSGAGTSPILVTSGLAFSEYAASSTGGAAAVVNNGEDVNRKFDCEAVTSGKIYMAFLFKTERTN
ncbi:MAG: choice-of-anchor D domain-containing protein, partial [Prevotellaceae bacterium]|nr:choice-of-anchor D domain-containing protein [Prevotellaceae bacterium]